MRILEIVLGKAKFIAPFLILLTFGQIIFGKHKWQYYPIYAFVLLYIIFIALNYFEVLILTQKMSRWIITIGIFTLSSSALFIYAFPKQKLPIPSGKYSIGTKIFELEDETRDEIYTKKEGDNRKIKYQIWYPSDDTIGYEKAKWITQGTLLTRPLAKSMFVPYFMLDQTTDIDSNSYVSAPISTELEKYPVVVISHGWKGFRELHTDFAEELASNGFIAVSIDHSYGSQAVAFEDGDVAYLNRKALPSLVTPSKFTESSNLLATTFGLDVALVLDDLEKQNNVNMDLEDKFDLDSIGVLGHSTGGGGDVYIALQDKRIKALMGLDAWVEPLDKKILEEGLSIPSLYLRSGRWKEKANNDHLYTIVDNSDNAMLIQMNQTTHVDFTMTYMISPLTETIGFTGKKGGRYGSGLQREMMLKFFDKNLRQNQELPENYLEEFVEKYDHLEVVDRKQRDSVQ